MPRGEPVPADARCRRPRPTEAADRTALVGHRSPPRSARGRRRSWIVDHGGPEQAQALADRRAAGEPLQYVLGRWPFRSLELTVDRRVLIPRPETEQVVEVALRGAGPDLLRPPAACSPPSVPGSEADVGPRLCVDLGTGSGAIALSLAIEGGRRCPGPGRSGPPTFRVDALEVAAGEPGRPGRRRCRCRGPGAGWHQGSWFDALPCRAARTGRPGGVQSALRGRVRVSRSRSVGA